MFELPLFPLNVVLFPGMPLQLHIFEERYKQMINDCLENGKPFGVTLIENDRLDSDPEAQPVMIGCTAEIKQVEPLEDGRMNIMTIGHERFRVHSVSNEKPYMTGIVSLAPLHEEPVPAVQSMVSRFRPLVIDYLTVLANAGKAEFDSSQIPNEPAELAYLAAYVLQLPAEDKQSFLSSNKADDLLSELYSAYRREVSMLRMMPTSDQGVFSFN